MRQRIGGLHTAVVAPWRSKPQSQFGRPSDLIRTSGGAVRLIRIRNTCDVGFSISEDVEVLTFSENPDYRGWMIANAGKEMSCCLKPYGAWRIRMTRWKFVGLCEGILYKSSLLIMCKTRALKEWLAGNSDKGECHEYECQGRAPSQPDLVPDRRTCRTRCRIAETRGASVNTRWHRCGWS